MNIETRLYRKRFIPNETVLLKDDLILAANNEVIVTRWNALKPRLDISYGYSAYFLTQGFKLSKVFNKEGSLVYWYCDIITQEYEEETNSLTVIDLLIDALIYSDGTLRVLDLDELAECIERQIIDTHLACLSLRHADHLFRLLSSGEFSTYQDLLDSYIE